MIAIVMSGAANYGAMQAGVLEVILESGFQPSMLVGSSAGALNALYLAADPSMQRAKQLQEMWRAAGPDEVGVPKAFVALRRIVQQKDGLVDSQPLAEFLAARLPAGVTTFGELEGQSGVKAFATAVELESGLMRVFGDDPEDCVIDGAMASSAVPPYFPPWQVGERRYLDGGVYAKLPLCVAIARGATQIVALDVTYPMGSARNAHGVMGVSGYSLSLMIHAQTAFEIAWAEQSGIPIRVLALEAPPEVPFWDYTKPELLIELGRSIARNLITKDPVMIQSRFQRILTRLGRKPRPHPLVKACRERDTQSRRRTQQEEGE
jgi:NTE family protein